MPTDQPSSAPAGMPTDAPELDRSGGGLAASGLVPPLHVEGGAPRGPDHNSPIDPGMPPTDADGTGDAAGGGASDRIGVPEPSPPSR